MPDTLDEEIAARFAALKAKTPPKEPEDDLSAEIASRFKALNVTPAAPAKEAPRFNLGARPSTPFAATPAASVDADVNPAVQRRDELVAAIANGNREAQAHAMAELRKDWHQQGKIGAGETLLNTSLKDVTPVVGSGMKFLDMRALRKANERLLAEERGEIQLPEGQRLNDRRLVTEYVLKQKEQEERGTTLGSKVTGTLKELPAFIGEFALTGGLANAGKAAGLKVAEKLGQGAIAKAAGNIGATAVGAAARTAGMTPRVGTATEERLMQGQSLVESLSKGFGDVFIENLSEVSGGAINQVAGKMLSWIPGGLAIQKAWMAKTGGKAADFARKMFEKGGFHGILEEVGEERLGDLLRGASGIEEFRFPTKEELAAELLAFSVPGVARAGFARSKAADFMSQRTAELRAEGKSRVDAFQQAKTEWSAAQEATKQAIPEPVEAPTPATTPEVAPAEISAEPPQAYRQVALDEAFRMLPDNRVVSGGLMTKAYFSSSPEYALGQGKNANGIVLGFDRSQLDLQEDTSKPAYKMAKQAGYDELVGTHGFDEYGRALNSVYIPPHLQPTPDAMPQLDSKAMFQYRLDRLVENGEWTREVRQDGGAYYRKKPPAPPIPPSNSQPDGAEPFGRPELANPGLTGEARTLMDAVDQARKDEGVPQVKPDEATEAEAEKLNFTPEQLLERAKAGGQLNDAETIAAAKVYSREATEAMKPDSSPEQLQKAVELANAWRETGTAQGRGLRQRRDRIESPAERMRDIVLTPPKDVQPSEWVNTVREIQTELAAEGIDIGNLDEVAKDPAKTAKVIHAVQTKVATKWDAFYEYWRNAILSGPVTQVANIAGNTANLLLSKGPDRFAEAVGNLAMQRPESAQLGEFKYLAKGVLPGVRQGIKNFFATFQTEIPSLETSIGRAETSGYDALEVAIGGKTGRGIRIPQRLLLAADDFFKTLIAQMEVGAHAYRQAKAEGLKGEALSKRIAALHADVFSSAWDAAIEDARKTTFNERVGGIGQAVLTARRSAPAIRYLVPFVTTPTNIFKAGINRTPLGVFKTIKEFNEARQSKDWSRVTPLMAQQALSSMALAALIMLNDDEDPWITGSDNATTRGQRELSNRTAPPYSIRWGDSWYSYARIEPLATVLGVMVDMSNAVKRKGPLGILTRAYSSALGQISTKTYVESVGDIIRIIDATVRYGEDEGMERVGNFTSKFATSFIPNLLRSTLRAGSETKPERRIYGTGDEWQQVLGKRTIQSTELGIIPDVPAVDVWGEPIQSTSNYVSPVAKFTPRKNVGDRVLKTWNNQHPDQRYAPDPMPRTVKLDDGRTIYLNDAQYQEASTLAGKTAAIIAGKALKNPDKPTAADIAVLRRIFTESRKAARIRVMRNVATTPERLANAVIQKADWAEVRLNAMRKQKAREAGDEE